MPRQPTEPMPQADFDAIEAAVMETARGRWFLTEYARRHRSADTESILAAIKQLEGALRSRDFLDGPSPVGEGKAAVVRGGPTPGSLAEQEASLHAAWPRRDEASGGGPHLAPGALPGGTTELAARSPFGTPPATGLSTSSDGKPDLRRSERPVSSDLVDDPTLAMSRAEKIALFC
ncbi:MAG: hypothetical protein U1E56_12525 [Bauldia sp.]